MPMVIFFKYINKLNNYEIDIQVVKTIPVYQNI